MISRYIITRSNFNKLFHKRLRRRNVGFAVVNQIAGNRNYIRLFLFDRPNYNAVVLAELCVMQIRHRNNFKVIKRLRKSAASDFIMSCADGYVGLVNPYYKQSKRGENYNLLNF